MASFWTGIKRYCAFYRWLASCILIILLTASLGLFIYTQASDAVQNKIADKNEGLSALFKMGVDSLPTNIGRIANEISVNHLVQEFIQEKKPLSDEQLEQGHLIGRDLSVYKSSNTEFDDLYIYCKNSDVIISSSGVNETEFYYKLHYLVDSALPSDYLKFLLRHQNSGFYNIERKDETTGTKKSVAFIENISIPGVNHDAASIVIIVDKTSLEKKLAALDELGLAGNKQIIDVKKSAVLASHGNISHDSLMKNINNRENSFFYVEGERNVMSYIGSDAVSDWVYAFETDKEVFWEDLYSFRMRMLWIMGTAFILGVSLAILTAIRSYKSINGIIYSLERRGVFVKGKNEFDFIKNVVDSVIDERDEITKLIANQKKALRESFLVSLLKGRVQSDIPVSSALEEFNISFNSEYFAVGVFYIKDIELLFEDEKELGLNEKRRLFSIIMNNIIEELIGEYHLGYVFDYNDILVCIINIADERIVYFENDIKDIYDAAFQNIKRYFGVEFIMSISTIHKGITEVPLAYEEAISTMEYKTVVGVDGLTTYNSIIEHSKHGYYYPIDVEKRILNYIKTGDEENAVLAMNDVFYINLKDGTLPVKNIKGLMVNLVLTLIKGLNMTAAGVEREFLEGINSTFEIIQTASVEEIKTKIFSDLQKVCELNRGENKSKQSVLIEKTINYISENYKNPEINATVVANAMGVHSSYLSSTFKEQTDEGLLHYINSVRVKAAKDLLLQKGRTIEKTAQSVGFSNARTFARAFKKFEGMPPSEYRDLAEHNS